MNNPITATLNGIPCVEADFRHRDGSQPSTATLTLPSSDAEQLNEGEATLVLSDNNSSVEIRSLGITSISSDNGDGLARVIMGDRRRGWSARVHGEREFFSLGDLVGELLTALGEQAQLLNLERADEIAVLQRWNDMPAAEALESLLAQFGQSFAVDLDGTLRAVSNAAPDLSGLPLIDCSLADESGVGTIQIVAPQMLVEREISGDWQAVCEDEDGLLKPLSEVAANWGLSESDIRSAVLYEGGLRALTQNNPLRTALLERYAYRCYQVPDADMDKLPIIAQRLSDDGTFTGESVEHTSFRRKSRNVKELEDPYELQSESAPDTLGYSFNGKRGLLCFHHVVGHLEELPSPVHNTRLEGRALSEGPTIQLTASTVYQQTSPILTQEVGSGDVVLQISRGELIPVLSEKSTSSTPLNAISNQNFALSILARAQEALPIQRLRARIAGAHNILLQPGSQLRIRCNAAGLVTTLTPNGNPTQRVANAFHTPTQELPLHSSTLGDKNEQNRHINAYHTGPLVLRASEDINQSETFVAAEAQEYDPAKDKLTLSKLGPIKMPFHVAKLAENKAGGWFLAAPIRQTQEGLQFLDDDENTSEDFEALEAKVLGGGTIPGKTDGLVLQGLDGETFLAMFDRPLVAQHRSTNEDFSIEVREISGDELDPIKRGPLHFPFVVSLSAVHAHAGVGGSEDGRGWVPTLNFKDLQTGTPDAIAHAGRGLFTEQHGFHLGRLAHLPGQGGPLMADSATCEKHRYGVAPGPDGNYIESAGHISTEAFFKVPGNAVFDAPLAFSHQTTDVDVGEGEEFQAEIKLHEKLGHTWNKSLVPHSWVITYRWPIYSTVPTVWSPREDPPYISEKNLGAPSFDWFPPPSTGEPLIPIPMPPPTINGTAWAPEPEPGIPDPSLGGGVAYFPGSVNLLDGAPWSYDGPQMYTVLHPGVDLAFGLPNLSGSGTPTSGAIVGLDASQALCFQSVDSSGASDPSKPINFEAPITAQPIPTPSSPPDGTIWNDDGLGVLDPGIYAQINGLPQSWASSSGSANDACDINQTAHGFSLGTLVMNDGVSGWQPADLSDPNMAAQGVVSSVADSNNFTVTFSGQVDLTGVVDDQGNPLTEGFYLASDSVPGGLRDPSGAGGDPIYWQPVAYVASPSKVSFQASGLAADITGVSDAVTNPGGFAGGSKIPVSNGVGNQIEETEFCIDPTSNQFTFPALSSILGSPSWAGDPDFSGNPTYSGEPSFLGDPHFSGSPTFDFIVLNSGSTITGDPSWAGDPDFAGNPDFTGDPSFSGSPSFDDIILNAGSTITGSPSWAGDPTFTGDPNVTGQLCVSDGTPTAPAIKAASDPNTGLVMGNNFVGIVAAGTNQLNVGSATTTSNNNFQNNGNLTVTGTSNLAGLNTSGDSIFNGDVTMNNCLDLSAAGAGIKNSISLIGNAQSPFGGQLGDCIIANSSTGDVQVDLPPISTADDGKCVKVRNFANEVTSKSSLGTVTVSGVTSTSSSSSSSTTTNLIDGSKSSVTIPPDTTTSFCVVNGAWYRM